jgi:hypothetical protein
MSEPTAACTFDTSTPLLCTLLRIRVEADAPVTLLGGLTVVSDLVGSSRTARPEYDASEDASSVSVRVTTEDGDDGNIGRGAFILVLREEGPEAREEEEALPVTSLLRRASTVLLPLADRLLP